MSENFNNILGTKWNEMPSEALEKAWHELLHSIPKGKRKQAMGKIGANVAMAMAKRIIIEGDPEQSIMRMLGYCMILAMKMNVMGKRLQAIEPIGEKQQQTQDLLAMLTIGFKLDLSVEEAMEGVTDEYKKKKS